MGRLRVPLRVAAVRERRAVVLGIVAMAMVVLAVVAGPSIARTLMHPRDAEAFQQYVSTYVDGWSSSADPDGPERDLSWVTAHPDEVLDEGDSACRWLASRPDAPDLDSSGKFSFDTLMTAYLKQAQQEHPLPLSDMGRSTVTAGAWAYLCWSEREAKTAPRSRYDD